jgi:hypothetical protein
MMKGQWVKTEHFGFGQIIGRESNDPGSSLYKRFIVKLSDCPEDLQKTQERFGGVFYSESQVTMIEPDEVCAHEWADKPVVGMSHRQCKKCKTHCLNGFMYSDEERDGFEDMA